MRSQLGPAQEANKTIISNAAIYAGQIVERVTSLSPATAAAKALESKDASDMPLPLNHKVRTGFFGHMRVKYVYKRLGPIHAHHTYIHGCCKDSTVVLIVYSYVPTVCLCVCLDIGRHNVLLSVCVVCKVDRSDHLIRMQG